jgi:hypothetical protein
VFLLLWLIVMLLPTIMSGDAPHFGRMTGAAPVIAILIALGIHHVSRITFHALSFTTNFQTPQISFLRFFALSCLINMTVSSCTLWQQGKRETDE